MSKNIPSRDQKLYETLKRSIAEIGYIRNGSLVRRFMPCGKPGCRCQDDPPRLHGPYYQWTRKVRGKTITVRLTEDKAERMKEWIDNSRHLDRIIDQMQRISLRVTERLLKRSDQ